MADAVARGPGRLLAGLDVPAPGDPGLVMRRLFAFQLSVVAAVVGIALGQFANPSIETDPARTALSLLAFFLMPLAAPPLVFHPRTAGGQRRRLRLKVVPVARPSIQRDVQPAK